MNKKEGNLLRSPPFMRRNFYSIITNINSKQSLNRVYSLIDLLSMDICAPF